MEECWPAFRYDSANTGAAPGNTGPVGDSERGWEFEADGRIWSSPAVADGVVYVGSHDGRVYALDAARGTERWSAETDSIVDSSPAVVDGTVYVGSDDGTLYALAAATGEVRWRRETGWNGGIGGSLKSSPTVVDGTVYVGSDDHAVYALSAADGSEQWRYATDHWVYPAPAVVDGTVYVGSDDTRVYAIDAEEGHEQWRFETDDAVLSSPAVVDDTVYVGSRDGFVYALAAEDRLEQWAVLTDGRVESSPAVFDGVVYVGSTDGVVYAIDAADGTVQWTYRTGAAVHSSPAVAGGVVYVGGDDGLVYGLDAADGSKRWSADVGMVGHSSPAVVGGTVYVGTYEGRVYALTGDEQVSGDPVAATESVHPVDPLVGGDVSESDRAFCQAATGIDSVRAAVIDHGVRLYDARLESGPRAYVKTTIDGLAVGAADRDRFERIVRQWQAVSSVTHVAALYDFGLEPRPWVAVEHGGRSADARAEHGPGAGSVRVLLDALEAVRAARRYNVSHLRLSPACLWVPDGEQSDRTRLHWNVERVLRGDADAVTPYTAPEQLPDSDEAVGRHTDVYQLGAVGYELLTGLSPFEAADASALATRIRSGEVLPPSQLASGLDPGVDDVIARAMHPEPDRRYRSLHAFGLDLRSAFE